MFEVLTNKYGRNFRYTETLCVIVLITEHGAQNLNIN